jgi:hypothetical protein
MSKRPSKRNSVAAGILCREPPASSKKKAKLAQSKSDAQSSSPPVSSDKSTEGEIPLVIMDPGKVLAKIQEKKKEENTKENDRDFGSKH